MITENGSLFKVPFDEFNMKMLDSLLDENIRFNLDTFAEDGKFYVRIRTVAEISEDSDFCLQMQRIADGSGT